MDGTCEKMPSTKFVNVKIKSLTCIEHERMIWIWPGNEPASPVIPSLQPPLGFKIHAEVCYKCLHFCRNSKMGGSGGVGLTRTNCLSIFRTF